MPDPKDRTKECRDGNEDEVEAFDGHGKEKFSLLSRRGSSFGIKVTFRMNVGRFLFVVIESVGCTFVPILDGVTLGPPDEEHTEESHHETQRVEEINQWFLAVQVHEDEHHERRFHGGNDETESRVPAIKAVTTYIESRNGCYCDSQDSADKENRTNDDKFLYRFFHFFWRISHCSRNF